MKFWTRQPAAAAAAALAASRAGTVSSVRPVPGRRRPRDGRIRRIAATMSVLLAAAVLAGAAGIPANASVLVSASARGWSVTPSPNPVSPTGQLNWVSCSAANSCAAVGTYVKASGTGVPLAERWNGNSWRIQPVPGPSGAAWSILTSVSCVSPSACEAVGVTVSRSRAWRVLAERWDGTRWQLQPIPSPAGGGLLNGVSCTSPSACTAVGGSPPGTSRKTLVERWNGSRWRIQSAPSPAGAVLAGIACTSSVACTAVGASNAGKLAERWNGTSWRIQPTPNPAGAQFTYLNTVACASASACIAVGSYHDSSGAFQSLAERWDGTSWAIQPLPRLPGGVMSQLSGVACTS